VIGPLVNLVVLRGDTSGDPVFADLVARLAEVALDAYDHSAAPFEWLVERLGGRRDLSRTPVFQVLVEYVSGAGSAPLLDGLTVTELQVPVSTSKFDLGLWLAGAPDGGLAVEVVWDTALYRRETAVELAGQLQGLLAFLATHPRARLSEIPVPPARREQPAAAPRPGLEAASGAATALEKELEKELAEIWADVLDRPAPGPDDDFFALGGHSLLIIRVANRIRDRLDLDVPLSTLFEYSVLRVLAARLAQLTADSRP
jgi:non-ribosomal peptide synthetase component F